jgi:hypothetical protein
LLTSRFHILLPSQAGGYYFSTGGSEMIADGSIKVKQGEIASFGSGTEITFKDGSKDSFDVVVFATGYTGFPDTIAVRLIYSDPSSPTSSIETDSQP